MAKKKPNNKTYSVSNMKKTYMEVVVPNLVDRFGYGNPMEVPKILSNRDVGCRPQYDGDIRRPGLG